jgi:Ion channel
VSRGNAPGVKEAAAMVGTALSRFCNIDGPAADAKDVQGIQQREDLGPLVPILAAVTVYLLIAVSFATVYNDAFQSDFRGFRLPEWIAAGSAEVLRTEMIYFSLVTLATLGYGDILPSSPLIQMLAVLEAVIGQFFMAVLVACLVGMFIYDNFTGGR